MSQQTTNMIQLSEYLKIGQGSVCTPAKLAFIQPVAASRCTPYGLPTSLIRALPRYPS